MSRSTRPGRALYVPATARPSSGWREVTDLTVGHEAISSPRGCGAANGVYLPAMRPKLTVEVWSDIACPWCYVGKRRLESALSRFAHADSVHVVYRAFELDPSAPPVRDEGQTYAQRLARKYGASEREAQAMIDRMVATAAEDGLTLDFVRIRPGNTFLAHRLLHLARERGLQERVKERMLRGYLVEGAPIGVADVALGLAVEGGLDPDEASGVVHGDTFADEVRADEHEARRLGIDGVPFFLLGRRYAVAGAQPAELLRKALEQTWEEQVEPRALEGAPAGRTCGPEGCDD